MEDANQSGAARWGFGGVWTEQRERIGVTADDERIDGQIELRFGWASRRCGCLFRALFRQVCVSPTRREAGLVLNPEPRMTGHVGFDSRVLRGVFQEVSRVGRMMVLMLTCCQFCGVGRFCGSRVSKSRLNTPD